MKPDSKKIIGIIAAIVAIVLVIVIAVIGAFTVENPDADNAKSSIVDEKVESTNKPEEENTDDAGKTDEKQDTTNEAVENNINANTSETGNKVYTPTFMYFISAKDEGYAEAMAVVEKLKKEYEGRVNFDIRDVDKNPQDLENYSVGGITPALIMLDTKNDICAFLPMAATYNNLKAAIDTAFAQ